MSKQMKSPSKEVIIAAIVGGFIIYWLSNHHDNSDNEFSDDLGI